MYLVISLLVLRAGGGIWLYQFLIIAYFFTLLHMQQFYFWSSQEQVQIFVCIYANFTHMKAKLNVLTYENLSIASLCHMNVDSMLI